MSPDDVLLSEASATKLICPLLADVPGYRLCCASACPMWRWAMAEPVDVSAYVAVLGKIGAEQLGEALAEIDYRDADAPPDPAPPEPRRGYCGLAGKPEYP